MRLTAILLYFLASSVLASAGSISEITGPASVKRDGKVIELKLGSPIQDGDTVETRGGRVVITFADKTTVQVTESSRLVIDQFVYDPKSGEGKLGARSTLGTVRYTSGAIAGKDPKNVNLRTPTATIAVRGTDFVMSVTESGSSMVILMPSCESNPAMGKQCGSGRIDVSSGGSTVVMDRPYQATMVERADGPPSPPVTVDLSGHGVSNNLHLSPPRTPGGQNIVQAARDAAGKTGDVVRKDDAKNHEAHAAKESVKESQEEERKKDEPTAKRVAAITATENPHLFKLWGDKAQSKQIGWLYEVVSESRRNYANVIQDMTTQAGVVVTQDGLTSHYNWSPGKPQGQITITQVNR